MSHPPIALALVVCDQLLTEPSTGKFSLVGLFTGINVPQFPWVHPQLAIYIALTDGYGTNRIDLHLTTSGGPQVELWKTSIDVTFPDPRAISESYTVATGISFPRAGEYRIGAFCGSSLLMERRLTVGQVVPRPPTARPPG